jgi:hypothetical protein
LVFDAVVAEEAGCGVERVGALHQRPEYLDDRDAVVAEQVAARLNLERHAGRGVRGRVLGFARFTLGARLGFGLMVGRAGDMGAEHGFDDLGLVRLDQKWRVVNARRET